MFTCDGVATCEASKLKVFVNRSSCSSNNSFMAEKFNTHTALTLVRCFKPNVSTGFMEKINSDES